MHVPRSLFLTLFPLLTLGSCADEPPTGPIAPDEMPRGFWFDSRFDPRVSDLTPDQQAAIERLGAIGYAPGYEEAPIEKGVTVHDEERAQPGFNLFSSGHAPAAYLADMRGEVLHTWSFEYADLPGAQPMEHPSQDAWRRVELLDDGSLLAIHEGLGILRVNAASELQWYYPGGAHHDFFIATNGHVFVLTRKPRIVSHLNPRDPLLEDSITELDAAGKPLRTVSLLDCLLASPWANDLVTAAQAGGDVLHTNTLELVDERLAARLTGVEAGQVLVCLREFDALATVDLDRRRVTWLIRPGIVAPHDPTVLDDGSILVFDNLGNAGYSRVLQFDAVSGEELWSYVGDPAPSFYSIFCGTAARLRGGNTLITESCAGRALEVTQDGEVVWRFASPHRAGPEEALVAALFEMRRLPLDQPLEWLEQR